MKESIDISFMNFHTRAFGHIKPFSTSKVQTPPPFSPPFLSLQDQPFLAFWSSVSILLSSLFLLSSPPPWPSAASPSYLRAGPRPRAPASPHSYLALALRPLHTFAPVRPPASSPGHPPPSHPNPPASPLARLPTRYQRRCCDETR